MQTAMADTTLPTIIDIPIDIVKEDPKEELERNDIIAFQHIIKGISQKELASKFNICQQRVHQIVQKYVDDEKYNKRLVGKWKKELSSLTMSTAQKIVESIDIAKLNNNSKTTQAAIMIDKSLLLSGDSTGQQNMSINIVNYGDLSINDRS
jgi:hypothetical protein